MRSASDGNPESPQRSSDDVERMNSCVTRPTTDLSKDKVPASLADCGVEEADAEWKEQRDLFLLHPRGFFAYQRPEPLTKSHRAIERVWYLFEGAAMAHGSGLRTSLVQAIF